jgi:hypothetical protein
MKRRAQLAIGTDHCVLAFHQVAEFADLALALFSSRSNRMAPVGALALRLFSFVSDAQGPPDPGQASRKTVEAADENGSLSKISLARCTKLIATCKDVPKDIRLPPHILRTLDALEARVKSMVPTLGQVQNGGSSGSAAAGSTA